ncbi:MAG: transposase [Victivallaceae bacterium]|nr:transposase [Victivallaceae bacterium]
MSNLQLVNAILMVSCNVFLKDSSKKILSASGWRRYVWTVRVSKWYRGFKKSGKQSIGRSRGGLTTKIHMVTASDRSAVSFSLSSGNAADAPEGRKLLNFTPANKAHRYLIMDRAYEGDETRALAIDLGWNPVVPPKQNRKEPWEYDRKTYILF